MCKTDYEALLGRVGAENANGPAPKPSLPNPGDSFRMRNEQYTMLSSGLLYKFTNGDPGTQYALIAAMGGAQFIITHSKLLSELQALEAKYVTLPKLLRAGPCEDGVKVLAKWVGCQPTVYDISSKITINAAENNRLSTQALYDFAKMNIEVTSMEVPTTWLEFTARVMGLIPKGAKLNRHALARLLGINL